MSRLLEMAVLSFRVHFPSAYSAPPFIHQTFPGS